MSSAVFLLCKHVGHERYSISSRTGAPGERGEDWRGERGDDRKGSLDNGVRTFSTTLSSDPTRQEWQSGLRPILTLEPTRWAVDCDLSGFQSIPRVASALDEAIARWISTSLTRSRAPQGMASCTCLRVRVAANQLICQSIWIEKEG